MTSTGLRGALRSNWIFSTALLFLTLIAYGPLVPSLGVYWDDWPSLWFLHFFGPGVFPHAFAIDRPAQGWLFTLTTAVFGESMLAWQLFGILARWLAALAFAWLLALIWPRQRDKAAWAAALFVIYPGFSQQFIPITYGHQFLIYAAFLASLALMILSIHHPRHFWALTLSALAAAVWCMFALEYFFGLELLRPALIWLALAQSAGVGTTFQRARRTALRWLPYAAAAGLFLAWRITHTTPRGTIVIFERLAEYPSSALIELLNRIGSDIATAAVLAWYRALAALNPIGVKTSVLAAYVLIVLAAAGATAALILSASPGGWGRFRAARFKGSPNRGPENASGSSRPAGGIQPHRWAFQAILLGLYALLIAGWPVWVTDLRLELTFPWDRFTLPLIPGAVLVLVGLIGLLPPQRPLFPILIVALLAGVSAGMHFHDGFSYRRDWVSQQDFFHQLAWRAPAIEPGTVLLIATAPFDYVTDNSLSAPLNWIYASRLEDYQMPYLMIALDARLGTQIAELSPNQAVSEDYRATHFSGSTSQALVLFYDPPRCLKVIDPSRDALLPNKPDFIADALPLSRPELIRRTPAEADARAAALFGSAPEQNWCYFYERADLSAQFGDWPQVVELADQALVKYPEPGREQAYELVPYIQGYAMTGRWEAALTLTRQSARLLDKMPVALCSLWKDIAGQKQGDPAVQAASNDAHRFLNCPSE